MQIIYSVELLLARRQSSFSLRKLYPSVLVNLSILQFRTPPNLKTADASSQVSLSKHPEQDATYLRTYTKHLLSA